MRRSGILIVMCLCLTMINQSYSQTVVGVGPVTSIGAKFLESGNSNYAGVGGYLGLGVRVPVLNWLAITPTLGYSFKGFRKINKTGWFQTGATNIRIVQLEYIDLHLPVQLKIQGAFCFKAGLQFGFLQKALYELELPLDSIKFNKDISSYSEKFDIGFIVGPEFQFKSGFGFNLLINPGLIDLSDQFDLGKNMLVTVGIHHYFAVKKER